MIVIILSKNDVICSVFGISRPRMAMIKITLCSILMNYTHMYYTLFTSHRNVPMRGRNHSSYLVLFLKIIYILIYNFHRA